MAGLSNKTVDGAIENVSRTSTRRRTVGAPIAERKTLPDPGPNLLEQAGVDTSGAGLLSKTMRRIEADRPAGFAARALEVEATPTVDRGRDGQVARARAIRERATPEKAPVVGDPPLRPLGKPGDYDWDSRRPAPDDEVTGILRKPARDWSATDALKVQTSPRYARTAGPDAEAAHRKVAAFYDLSYPGTHEPGPGPAGNLFDPDERRRLDADNDRRRAAEYRARTDKARERRPATAKPAPPTAAIKPAGSAAAQAQAAKPSQVDENIPSPLAPPLPFDDGGTRTGPAERARSNRREKTFAERLRYYLGPHAAKGVENIAGLAGFLIETVSPGADIDEAMAESARVTEAVKRGDLADSATRLG